MESRPITVLGISGSLRRGSHNTAALREAGSVAPDDVTVELVSIGDLPIYNADVEREHGFPDPVQRFRDEIAAADGLLIATPEYNYSVTGALKNALDWASRRPSPLDRAPAAILGVGGRLGTARSQQHLRDILRHNDLQVVTKPEVLIPGGRSKFDGGRLNDERTLDQIRRLMVVLRRKIVEARSFSPRVLVVGRHQELIRDALNALNTEGFRPEAALTDDEALTRLKLVPFTAIAIGGGVEPESRERLAAAAGVAGIEVVEVSGPADIADKMRATLAG
jgi:chromate reductase